jgi:stage IV sporulation protein FB
MPLDGGKIMQAVLSLAMPYYKAIRGSVRFSLLLAACMACFALLLLGVRVIHLNLLMVGGFLLYSNWYERLHLPYRFLRFLLARYRMPRRWNRTRKIVVKRLVPGEIVKQFYRERNHRILLLASDKPGKKEEILSEHQLLARYFRSFSP